MGLAGVALLVPLALSVLVGKQWLTYWSEWLDPAASMATLVVAMFVWMIEARSLREKRITVVFKDAGRPRTAGV